jgi:hypothetical protein
MTTDHHNSVDSATNTTPRDADPLAFAMAPFAPVHAMANVFGQAYLQLWSSQSRLMMASARTAADAWRSAMRRQQDALFGASESAAEDAQAANDAEAVQAAAEAVMEASQDLAQAQARALELLRLSA